MKNLSRRDFGKAIAAVAVAGGSAAFGPPAGGEITQGDLPVTDFAADSQERPDSVLVQIADYVDQFEVKNEKAYSTAHLLALDSLACCFYSLCFPACVRMLGPVVPGTAVPHGARVPGTDFALDPVEAAFSISCMVRWLDFNDVGQRGTEPGTPGHLSDNLGGILACADYLSQVRVAQGMPPLVMRDVLTALIKAYEVQSVIGLNGSNLPTGLDYVWWTKIATAAVVTKMLGGTRQQIVHAVSQAFADVTTLRLFRDEPTYGPRESWNSADATSRGVRLALITHKGEMGYPTVLTSKRVGVYDALYKGKPFNIGPFGTFAVEHAVLKPLYPSEIAIQSPLECATRLHPLIKDRLSDIDKISVWTYSENWSREGDESKALNASPLTSPAARGHDLKYAIAVGLLFGNLTGADYEDRVAANPLIGALRGKTIIKFDRQWATDSKSERASLPGGIQIHFKDGTGTDKVQVEYPLGHPVRRTEAIPVVTEKFKTSLRIWFPAKQQETILSMSLRQEVFEATPVNKFLEAFTTPTDPIKVSQTTVGRMPTA